MIDMLLAAVIAASTLFGLLRGFVSIVVGTLSWLLAGWAAFQFGNEAAHSWAAPLAPGTGQLFGGYVAVFVAVLVLVNLLGMLLKGLLRLTLLGGVDRLFGGLLGLLRGLLLACVLVLLAGFTSLPAEPGWQRSQIVPWLQPVTDWMQARLPTLTASLPPVLEEGLPGAMGLPWPGSASSSPDPLGKPAATGDNGVLGEVVAGRGWPRAVDPSRGAAGEHATAPALPMNIEPAPLRPDDPAAPARSGSSGQARPTSL